MNEEQNPKRVSGTEHDTTNPTTNSSSTTNRPEQDVPGTIGVYDRPTGLRRFPAWLIVLVLVILALLAYVLFSFVL